MILQPGNEECKGKTLEREKEQKIALFPVIISIYYCNAIIAGWENLYSVCYEIEPQYCCFNTAVGRICNILIESLIQ